MYAKKPHYEYVTSDTNGHSHFRREVKRGEKAGTMTGCKYGACTNDGISPLLSSYNSGYYLRCTSIP